MRIIRPVTWLPLVLSGALAVSAAGCGKDDPQKYVKSGDQYVEQGRLREAVVDYRHAIQLDPKLGEARLKLAGVYERQKDVPNAVGEYVRAADLLPDNLDAQLKAGNYLLLTGKFEDAQTRATEVLKKDPNRAEAQVLRGNALAGMNNFDEAVTEYETAIAIDPARQEAFVNIGTIQLLKGNREAAEEAFKKAVEAAPKSFQARLALANFYWASARIADAETEFKAALAIDPASLPANRALGVFYTATRRVAEAEPYFKALATEGAPPEASATLAQYYIMLNRRDDARRVLDELATRKDGAALATVRLAALDAAEGHRARAQEKLRGFLETSPNDLPARLLYADLLVRDQKPDEALAFVTKILSDVPSSAEAHQLAGAIYARTDRRDDAIREYETVLTLSPRPFVAALQLSRLHLTGGQPDKAITYAEQALGLEPRNPDAQGLLVRSHIAKGDTTKARDIVADLSKKHPGTPGVSLLTALIQLADRNVSGARSSYLAALKLLPSHLEALEGVTAIDLNTGRAKEAMARVDEALTRSPENADLLMLAARAAAATGDTVKTESLLKKAIAVDSSRLLPYSLLGQLYARQRQLDDARQQFEDIVKRDPKSVGARTMVAMLLESQGKKAEAEKAYEQVLAIDGRAPVAANNLAWIYVASNRNLDQALQLAQTAHQALPEEPAVNDTLGWIFVQKDMAPRAVPFLETSAKRAPNDPTFHYHLGTAYLKAGESEKAKGSLKKALALKSDFEGADEAKKALERLGS